MLEEARRRVALAGAAGAVVFERGDLRELRFRDESFDRIFCWGVVVNIPAAEAALAELARILRRGGRLALYVTNNAAWDYMLLAAGQRILQRVQPKIEQRPLGRGCWYSLRNGPLWVWRFDIQALTRRMESFGLYRTHRIAGSLTEMHVRLRGRLRDLVLRANGGWYGLGLPAGPCVTDLLVFEKSKR